MKISTKGRYALNLMLYLATHNTGEYTPLKDIARSQEISEKYLEQIIPSLSKAGYVSSIRGAQGGYRIAKSPSEYTVGMIVRLMEGEISPAPCMKGGTESCSNLYQCVTIDVWRDLKKAMDNVLDGITLEDLVNKYHDKCGSDYCI